jgi:hypothetical protein
MTPNDIKVRENWLRRKAKRRGLILRKSPRRDPDALDYGLWALIDPRTNVPVTPSLYGQFAHSMSLEDVELYFVDRQAWLAKVRPDRIRRGSAG